MKHAHLPSHLSAHEARVRLDVVHREEGALLAEGLALIALVDLRRDYRAAGYSCMKHYCTGHLKMSTDRAAKRLQAARACVNHARLLLEVANGRLSLGTLLVLAPHLTEANADELLDWSAHRSREEIAGMLAARRQPTPPPTPRHAPEVAPGTDTSPEDAPGHPENTGDFAPSFEMTPPVPASPSAARARGTIQPGAPGTYELRLTLTQEEHDALRRVQDLLARQEWSRDLGAVYARAIALLGEKLLDRKLGAGKGRDAADCVGRGRHIPMAIRRAVWERDGGCCSFVSEDGHRCGETRWLEFDHRVPLAKGGVTTVGNVRVLCRAHNQFEAERVLGEAKMRTTVELAQRERARADAAKQREAARLAALEQRVRDGLVLRALVTLGFSLDEARLGLALTEHLPEASDEARMQHAVRELRARRGGGKIELGTSPAA